MDRSSAGALDAERQRLLRSLPAVSTLCQHPAVRPFVDELGERAVVPVIQEVLAATRQTILTTGQAGDVLTALLRELEQLARPRLEPVINATGVVIHTNLGRAPVSEEAAQAMADAARRYTALEIELETGRRGGRMAEISRLLSLLTGAEAGLAVNNNAAAVLLVLSTFCAGRAVLVSRSQAVEIGGGFRIPDVLRQSGARLVEVGTTNRTYVRDYEAAISEETAAILSVHWSNFRIIGFTHQPSLEELAELAHAHGLLLIEDVGSGALLDTAQFGLAHEPTVQEAIAAGADLVCFSGDKLLGGPQAGLIVGRRSLIERLERHPLARAIRADKTALAGLATTLRHYVRGEAMEKIPVWRMIAAPVAALEERCRNWAAELAASVDCSVVATEATVGGGSLPGETLPSVALAIPAVSLQARYGLGLEEFARRLRLGRPPVIGRVEDERLMLDARTVLPEQDRVLVTAIRRALGIT
ncbi:L-seryl-tRNA(Sec) selenium transferase [Thermomicrobium sp. 4228-Ro]|uniref:L-seryl-tRNA(Sec) selenium transferase n=1 Tax=Thermomicrobium sp. 4228-Ro TaxID=2993937 RepID=UPI0022493A43|nr:L-seryl-tRNA(Sec) selenium transferase [Thermomicrobium sp. 4228-Ro]MCX2726446.1 L-seryl-tRNA(Sec) selenium transferase [Thermomicrobium sp. 4228-Ro]